MEVGKVRKEEIKPSLFVEDMIVYLENNLTTSTLELTVKLRKDAEKEVHHKNLGVFSYTNN